MYTASLHLLVLNMSIVLSGLSLVTGQELDDYYTEYEGYNNDPQDHVISCYVCTYHVRQGHTSGMSSCRDPFDKFGIPEVECTGACAKIYSKSSDTDYTVNRVCLPNCKDLSDEHGYTECCHSSLCNGAQPSGSPRIHLVASLFISLALILLTFCFT